MKIINTLSEQTIYKSLCSIFNIDESVMKKYILDNKFRIMNQYSENAKCINLKDFLNTVESKKEPSDLFDYVTLSHLTTRISNPKNSPLYNLDTSLLKNTDISNFFKKCGILFRSENGKIKVINDGKKVDWNEYEQSGTVQMIKHRLEYLNKYMDRCINGYLFNEKIYHIRDINHLNSCPEIIQNILCALNKNKYIYDWYKNAKPYILTFRANISDIIFDGTGLNYLTKKQKTYRILRCVLFYLSKKYLNRWSNDDNPMVRLKDKLNVRCEDMVNIQIIEKD
ncbi:hypothetical protein NIE88_12630 [Sporolactobacillus shoreicorticis]|uniref:Uncharacterized protein n=1 Tax=Sporolactobacillus shoreicorticis TaxID=1923877 RepID=A0ABW5S852_9BACL|nr:hypothetical protein [Sporolactobacillus shoreicorticis]MCO7126610.1 hypothetical protein [Sporolactobacillus shoreicorticis]